MEDAKILHRQASLKRIKTKGRAGMMMLHALRATTCCMLAPQQLGLAEASAISYIIPPCRLLTLTSLATFSASSGPPLALQPACPCACHPAVLAADGRLERSTSSRFAPDTAIPTSVPAVHSPRRSAAQLRKEAGASALARQASTAAAQAQLQAQALPDVEWDLGLPAELDGDWAEVCMPAVGCHVGWCKVNQAGKACAHERGLALAVEWGMRTCCMAAM